MFSKRDQVTNLNITVLFIEIISRHISVCLNALFVDYVFRSRIPVFYISLRKSNCLLPDQSSFHGSLCYHHYNTQQNNSAHNNNILNFFQRIISYSLGFSQGAPQTRLVFSVFSAKLPLTSPIFRVL